MIVTIWNGQSFDTDKDLTASERHILQKLFIWQALVASLEEFREKKDKDLELGWNNSGPLRESHVLGLIIKDLEKKIATRLAAG